MMATQVCSSRSVKSYSTNMTNASSKIVPKKGVAHGKSNSGKLPPVAAARPTAGKATAVGALMQGYGGKVTSRSVAKKSTKSSGKIEVDLFMHLIGNTGSNKAVILVLDPDTYVTKLLMNYVAGKSFRLKKMGFDEESLFYYVNDEVQYTDKGYPHRVFLINAADMPREGLLSMANDVAALLNGAPQNNRIKVRVDESSFLQEGACFYDLLGLDQTLSLWQDDFPTAADAEDWATLNEEDAGFYFKRGQYPPGAAEALGAPESWSASVDG